MKIDTGLAQDFIEFVTAWEYREDSSTRRHPVHYRWNRDPQHSGNLNFVAEELEKEGLIIIEGDSNSKHKRRMGCFILSKKGKKILKIYMDFKQL